MSLSLTIETGRRRGEKLAFASGEVVLGRSDECDLVLDETGISRRHARLHLEGATWVLSDLGSANGTTVNGVRAESRPVVTGDRLGVGPCIVLVELGEGVDTRVTKAPATVVKAAAKAGRAGQRDAPSSQEGRSRSSRLLRPLALVVVLGIAGSLGFVAWKGGPTTRGLPPCPAVVDMRSIAGVVFGHGIDADCAAPSSGLKFGFKAEGKRRYVLRYAPFYAQAGELSVSVNGRRLEEVPAGPNRRAFVRSLTLPDDVLKVDARNEILLTATGGDSVWGVERVELESIGLAEADAAKADEHYRLGAKLYRDKNIAAPNLYNAWMELREARRHMEGLEPKPDVFRPTLDLIADIDRELDAVCQRHLFSAAQDARYGRDDRSDEAFRFILVAFPGDAHPCRAKAESASFAP
jgi:hypothetical protein